MGATRILPVLVLLMMTVAVLPSGAAHVCVKDAASGCAEVPCEGPGPEVHVHLQNLADTIQACAYICSGQPWCYVEVAHALKDQAFERARTVCLELSGKLWSILDAPCGWVWMVVGLLDYFEV